MRGEQDGGHRSGEQKVGGEGVAAAADEVGDGAEPEHPQGDGDQRAAEEAHRGAGEVEDVAEREVVEVGVGAEQRTEGDSGLRGGGGEGEVSAEEKEQCAERDEEEERAAQGIRCGFRRRFYVGCGEQAADEESECGERGEVVVLLPGADGEEAEDDAGPEEESE